ncbi:UNVERIFIED_CONTAM: hypothetical protein GTU68_013716 [Idotea baltica]|nr:hypothetical protein [Idotea baltica]
MPVKLRLQRHGRKRRPYYHIVVADARAPRDGKFIEKIGMYNPNTQPADIDIDVDKALEWLKNGAQPTNTVRAEVADQKFADWKAEKSQKLEGRKGEISEAIAQEEAKKVQEATDAPAVEAAEATPEVKTEEAPVAEEKVAEVKTEEAPAEDAAAKKEDS